MTSSNTHEIKACYHCKDACIHEIIHDDKSFCCHGCVVVYDILQSQGLCNYYDLEEQSNITLKSVSHSKFDYLDDKEVVAQVLDFKDDTSSKVTFFIPSIHCSSCIWLLEKLYKLKEGIYSSRVNFPAKKCFISFDHNVISLRVLVELLTTIGYEPQISLASTDTPPKKDYKLLYQIGFAGFAFGNIMMLSFPEYLGYKDGVDDDLGRIFSIINLVIATPLLIYGGQNYLKSAFFSIRQGRLNIDVPISLGMIVLYSRSAFEIIMNVGAGFLDSLAGLIFFLLVGKWFQQLTYASISFEKDYKSYFPVAINVVENGIKRVAMINDLKPGDTIEVKHGELIPADGILKSDSTNIDYSFVNGEDRLVPVLNGNAVYAGGRQKGGSNLFILTKSVSQSYLLSLWNNDIFTKSGEMVTSKIADRFSKYFTYIILLISLLGFIYWYSVDFYKAINVATSVLIVSCPCALALAIPFVFGNVLRILASKGFYIKNTAIIEYLDTINYTVFDKTGTLTDLNALKLFWVGSPLNIKDQNIIASLVAQSNHPISKKIFEILNVSKSYNVTNFEEVIGKGIGGIVNNKRIFLGNASFISKMCNSKIDLNNMGTHIYIDTTYKGFYDKKSQERHGLKKTLDFFKGLGKRAVISGDGTSDKKLMQSLFTKGDELLFDQTPQDKLTFIKKLQEEKNHVLMIGDGLNDSGALMQSDVGIVVADDVNNFTPACDIILNASNFDKLPVFLAFAKDSIKIVYFSYTIAFFYNVVGISFALGGLLSPIVAAILMPISSITIVVFSFLATYYLSYKKRVNKISDINHIYN